MELLTRKKLVEQLGISKMALSKRLSNTPFTLIEDKGSTKKVKAYTPTDLPADYQAKLGLENTKESKPTHISVAKFTSIYLLAPPEKQKTAIQKCKLIEFYMKKDSSVNTQSWLNQTLKQSLDFDELGSISLKQLYDWFKKYREAKAKGVNVVEAFIDTRGAVRGVKAMSEEQKESAVRYFLRANRPMISEVYRNMCHTFGDTMPSYDVLNSYYNEWKRLNPLLYEFSKSPDSAKNKYLTAYGSESEKAAYKNHYWELDSTPADVICSDGKRYTILAAIDIHTRRPVLHVSESSSSYSISQLLRKAIIKLGIPENVVIDNGRDYTSIHFESICINLGINMVIVPPFSGECKPHVERFFGTLSRELFEQMPGYIGHNVAQRAEIQARKSFAHKIESQTKWREEKKVKTDEEKQAWRDAWKIKKENLGLELSLVISADELQMWCDNWVDKMYEQRRHGGLDMKPIDKWNANTSPVQTIPDIRMLDLLLGESVTRRVGKKGISYDGCNYADIELVELTGQYVHIMAPEDMGQILVYNKNMEFVCIAVDEEHRGENRHLARKARNKSLALMKQLDKIVKEAQATKDVTIMDRIEAVSDARSSKTFAVTKHTEAVDRLIQTGKELEAFDAKELEKSIRYDFTQKDEEGLPPKVLANGRPPFKTYMERFIWVLEHDGEWNDKDEKLKDDNPEIYEMAYSDFLRRKAG
ncbi:MAG: transposase family protein [Campylobacterales bacterium]|nr:transposase family protein [Campylobacterales bacterium]